MNRPTIGFQHIMFALLVVWFLLLSATFFISRPIALIALLPDLLLLFLITAAAYSIGSFAMEQLKLDEVLLPAEDFVLSTVLGMGGLAFLTMVVGMLGLLTWWTVGFGLILAIGAGFYRIIGLVTPPAYLFGPEDLGDEGPDPISWLQYIFIAIWVIAMANFCFLPPVHHESLMGVLGTAGQWVTNGGIGPENVSKAGEVSIVGGLWAMGLALRSAHMVNLINGLLGGLAMGAIYSCVKRYCGPLAARSSLLVAISLPIFAFGVLAPHEALTMALFQFCAFFCMLRWFDEDRKRWAVLGGIFIGLSFGVSTTAVFFLAPLVSAAFVWAVIRKRWVNFLLNALISAVGAAIAVFPWPVMSAYLLGSPFAWARPLLRLGRPPFLEGLNNMISLPLAISFPLASEPTWEVIGPIFLVFIPFYFITYRKTPATGLATATGLAFLGFGEFFSLGLPWRLAGFMLLAIPAAMAAHRFVESGWRKKAAIGLLFFLIGWQAFHAAAMIESVYPNPHRFLLGLESAEQFLRNGVDYYPAAEYINASLPADAHILVHGGLGALYIERRITKAEVAEPGRVEQLCSDDEEDAERAVRSLRRRGYTHLLVNRSDPREAVMIGRLDSRLGWGDHVTFLDGAIVLYSLPDTGDDEKQREY